MSFRGLQLVRERKRPFITLSSIRNLSNVGGEVLKAALKATKITSHRVVISWGQREFHTSCIRLEDLPALNEKLEHALPEPLITEILEDYRKIV